MTGQQIPFLQQFGAVLDEAIAAPAIARRRRMTLVRRVGIVTVAMALVGGGVATAAAKLSRTPEELATGTIMCTIDESGQPAAGSQMTDVAVDWAGADDPVRFCAAAYRAYHRPVPALVPCAVADGIQVISGRDPAVDCARHGYEPVPAGLAAAQRRAAQLQRDVIALEDTADCIPVPDLQRRLADLLQRTGWTRWRPSVRLDRGDGACGAVSDRFRGRSSIGGSLVPDTHEIVIRGEPPLSVRERVDGVGGLSETMPTITGERCWSKAALRQRIALALKPTGLPYHVVDQPPLRPNGELTGPYRGRWLASCAVLTGVELNADGTVEVDVLQEKPK